MWKVAVILVSSLTIVTACDDNLELDVETQQSALEGAKALPRLAVTADQLCTDVTVPTANGETLTGTRRCESTAPNCEAIGDTDCTMMDANLYGVHDPDLKPENIRAGVELGEKGGQAAATAPVCNQDGQKGCLAQGKFVAVDTSAVAAKTIAGQTLAGVAGAYDPGYPARENVLETETVNGEAGLLKACTQAGQSSCIPSANYVPVTTAQLDPAIIRRSVTIGGVTGTYDGKYSDCTADGESSCLTTTNFVALLPTDVETAKVRSQIKIAGKTGTLAEAPAACSATLKAACVTSAAFPSADYDLLTAKNIKVGVQLPGYSSAILGEYPSIAHPLAGAQAGVIDLKTANFNARMESTDSFEYWDSTGQRHTNTGDDNLDGANLVNTVTLFSVSGTVAKSPAACGDNDEVDCVTSTTHPSYDKSKLVAENIKNNVQIRQGSTQVTGAWPSAQNKLSGDTTDADLSQTNFNQTVASGAAFEYWNAAGVRVGGTGSSTLIKANIVPGATIFGVQGNGALRPANCGDGDTTGCVTTMSHPSYLPANFPAKKIKNGVTIGLVTGKYPSEEHLLADNDAATANLKGSTFAAQITSDANAPFEYWDNNGTRYTGAGNGHLSSVHLRKDVKVFGKTGTLTPRGNDCTAAGQTGCVATEDFPSYNPSKLTESVLKTGVTVMGVTGKYPSTAYPLPDDDPNIANVGDFDDYKAKLASENEFEFWDYRGRRVVAQGDPDLVGGNIKDGVTIFDVEGTMTPRPSDCNAGNQDSCVATSRYKSVDTVNVLTPGVLKNGVVLGGVTGKYPSAAYPLEGALAGRNDLKGGIDFNSAITTQGSIEFFTSTGEYETLATVALKTSDVKDGVTIFGVEGTTPEAPDPCSSNVVTGCLTSTNFPSYQSGAIKEGELKSGVTIGGVVGRYPSSNHKLQEDSGRSSLTSATFNAKVKSDTEFEYWDIYGNHHVKSGSANITAENIKEENTIFGVVGEMKTGNVVVDVSKVRAGVSVGNQTGSLKLACNNSGSSKTNTIDDYNDGNGMPTGSPFGSEQSCSSGVFEDQKYRTDENLLPANCGTDFACVFKDKVTGLFWHSSKSNSKDLSFVNAKNFCEGLSAYGGGWRIPTHKEYVTAYVNGLRKLTIGNGGLYPGSYWYMWTSTYSSQSNSNPRLRIMVQLDNLSHRWNDPTNKAANKTLCVKNGG